MKGACCGAILDASGNAGRVPFSGLGSEARGLDRSGSMDFR